MRLLINTSVLRFGGAIQVALSILEECRSYTDHEFFVALGPGPAAQVDRQAFPANFRFEAFDFGAIHPRKIPTIKRSLSELERRVQPDCVLTTSGPAYWKSTAPHVIGFNRPLYIYPESPYIRRMTIRRRAKLRVQRELHGWMLKREADAFIVQTDDVNRRLRQWLRGVPVHTVTNTCARHYLKQPRSGGLQSKRNDGVFRVLTLSSYYPHKDLEIIPAVLDVLRTRGILNVEFLLTLSESEYRTQLGGELPPGIRLMGKVSAKDGPALYQSGDAMFLPTLAECFSASYPEAMAMERPIITTDLGFARSICGEAATYFEPSDPHSAADALQRVKDDSRYWERLIMAGRERLREFDSPATRTAKILALCETLSCVGQSRNAA